MRDRRRYLAIIVSFWSSSRPRVSYVCFWRRAKMKFENLKFERS